MAEAPSLNVSIDEALRDITEGYEHQIEVGRNLCWWARISENEEIAMREFRTFGQAKIDRAIVLQGLRRNGAELPGDMINWIIVTRQSGLEMQQLTSFIVREQGVRFEQDYALFKANRFWRKRPATDDGDD
jgi:hypothetical protein